MQDHKDHKKYGKTLLKWTLFIDYGTVLNVLNSVSQFYFTCIIDAKLLHL